MIGDFPTFISEETARYVRERHPFFGGMKMVTVNGKKIDISGKTLSEYLEIANYHIERIAVELNEEIVPKSQYDSTVIQDNDVIEVVSFMAGG